MKAVLTLEKNMKFIGKTPKGHETVFDTVPAVGGDDTATPPMEVMLQSLAGCTAMDVVSILRKKRVQIDKFWVEVEGERGDQHPKMFTKVHLVYNLVTPNGEEKDLIRSVDLSQNKYCGASAMFKAAGCEITYETKVIKS